MGLAPPRNSPKEAVGQAPPYTAREEWRVGGMALFVVRPSGRIFHRVGWSGQMNEKITPYGVTTNTGRSLTANVTLPASMGRDVDLPVGLSGSRVVNVAVVAFGRPSE